MAEVIYTKNAPDAIGPYSQAIKTNGLVFTSGQIAINPATGNVEETTIEGQTEQVMKNLKNLLEAAGSSLEKAVKTVCFLADMNDFAAFNAIYGQYFTGKPDEFRYIYSLRYIEVIINRRVKFKRTHASFSDITQLLNCIHGIRFPVLRNQPGIYRIFVQCRNPTRCDSGLGGGK